MNTIARMPVASADEFGEPITDIYGLEPAAEVVRRVLRQDRSMYAWVARTCMMFLDMAIVTGAGDWSENLATAMSSVGVEPGNQLRPDLVEDLPAHVRQRVLGLHSASMSIFWVVAQPNIPGKRDRTIYRQMFESSDQRTVLMAHDIAAWASVIVGRLRNRGLTADSSLYSAAYVEVPPMWGAGWYPNPYNAGDVINGEPNVQRYWDGEDWTDNIRFWVGRQWDEQKHSMRTAPNN